MLAGSQVFAVEGVGFSGGGETCILADGPGAAGVHGGFRAAHVGGEAGQGVGVLQVLGVGGGVEGFDVDAFGCLPDQVIGGFALALFGGHLFPVSQRRLFDLVCHNYLKMQDSVMCPDGHRALAPGPESYGL